MQNSSEKSKKALGVTKRVKRFHWWYILIAIVLILIIAAGGLYFYVNGKLQRKDKYSDNWSQAQAAASDTGSGSESDDGALSSLDAGDFSKVQAKNYPIIKVKRKDPNVENILLMGIDGGAVGGVGVNRADSIIVASINTKTNTLKLASLLRDTKTYFPNTGTYHKLNAAFSYGGPGLQIDVINYAYKLDIQEYIQIDFDGFTNIINTIGGVPISLSAQEAAYSYINVGTKAGVYQLNGAQALGYTRTRKIDTDFERTQRQRNVMMAIYNKFKDAGLPTKVATLNQCLGYFQTNIPTAELMGKLPAFTNTMSGNIPQIEIPTEGDGMYTTEESPIWFWDLNWDQEVPRLQNFLYGN